jgi:hypothetical protein
MDLVIEDDEHAFVPRLRRAGDAQRIDEVQPASVPRALAGRCAPTSTTGCALANVRFREKAVSSNVAVPCGITNPETPGLSRAIRWISARSSIHSFGPISVLPTWKVTGSRNPRKVVLSEVLPGSTS